MLTSNQYNFMLRTGKYYPDDDIKFNYSNYYFERFNPKGMRIYCEISNGYWEKHEFDANNNLIYYENSEGRWFKRKYDSNGKCIQITSSNN